MSLVYIVTANQVEGKQIFESLSQIDISSKYRLEFEVMRPTQLPNLIQPGVDLIVYNSPHAINMNLKQQFQTWRKRGFLSSVLMLTKLPELKMIREFDEIKNFLILEKPYEDRELNGISAKLLNSVEVQQRKFRRFNTNQKVEITSYKTDYKSKSQVQNISMGGLCIEGTGSDLKIGDLLKIHFVLDKINADRVMHARVVWVKNADVPMAGVQFVKEEDVYNDLLNAIG